MTLTASNGIRTAGDISTSNDAIRFNSATTLTADVSLSTDTGGGNIRFGATLNGGHDLTLTAGTGNIIFTGAVGGTTPLAALTITSAADVTASRDVTAARFEQTAGTGETRFEGALETSAAAGIDVRTSYIHLRGGVTTEGGGTLTLYADPLMETESTSGTIRIRDSSPISADGAVTLTALGSAGTTVDGDIRIAGDISTTDDNITFEGSTRLTGNISLTAGSGTVRFDERIYTTTMRRSLQVAAGSVTFAGDITAADLTVTADAFTLENNISASGAVALTASSGRLMITGGGRINADGAVMLTASTGGIQITGNILTSGSDITFRSNTTLTGNTSLATNDSSGGAITFRGTVDGGHGLMLEAGTGDVTFMGVVGGATRLGALTIANANNVDIGMAIDVASFRQTAGSGLITLSGDLQTSAAEGVAVRTRNIRIEGDVTTRNMGPVNLHADPMMGAMGLSGGLIAGVLLLDAGAGIAAEGAVTLRAGVFTMTAQANPTMAQTSVRTDADISLTADNMSLAGLIRSGAGELVIAANTPARAINLGGSANNSGGLALDAGELNSLEAATIRIGNGMTTGDITFTGAFEADAAFASEILALQSDGGAVSDAANSTIDLGSRRDGGGGLIPVGPSFGPMNPPDPRGLVIRAGAVDLARTAHDFDVVAAEISGTAATASIRLRDSDVLVVGSVDGVDGISAVGDISITAGRPNSSAPGLVIERDIQSSGGGDVSLRADMRIRVDTRAGGAHNVTIATTGAGDLEIDSDSGFNAGLELRDEAGGQIALLETRGSGDIRITGDVSIEDNDPAHKPQIIAGGKLALAPPPGWRINLGDVAVDFAVNAYAMQVDAAAMAQPPPPLPLELNLRDADMDALARDTQGELVIGDAQSGEIRLSRRRGNPFPDRSLALMSGGSIRGREAGVEFASANSLSLISTGFGAISLTLDVAAVTVMGPEIILVNITSEGSRGDTRYRINSRDEITIVQRQNNMLIESISTAGRLVNIDVRAGMLLDYDNDDVVDISARTARIDASGGIGTSSPGGDIETALVRFIARAGGGDIVIDETDALTVESLQAVTGDISIEAGGLLTLGDGIQVSFGTDDVGSAGDLSIRAAGLSLHANTALTSSGGNIRLQSIGAGNAMQLNGDISATAMGTISLMGAGAINQGAGSLIQTASGAISLASAAGGITVNQVQSTANAMINVTATGAAITAVNGMARLGAVGSTSTLVLTAGTDIGTAALPLPTDVGVLRARAGGAIHIREANALQLGDATGGISAGGLLNVTATNIDLGADIDVGALMLDVGMGGIFQRSGRLRVAGATTLAAGDFNDIQLDTNPANDFDADGNGAQINITSVANVNLSDANDLTLGAVGVTGSAVIRVAGDITFSTALDNRITLVLGAGGDITFMGAVGNANTSLRRVLIMNAGNVNINSALNADTLTQQMGTGDTTFGGAVRITSAANINTTGDISFGSTLDGDHDLTLASSTGDITFTGVVGGTTSLDAVSITNAGNVNINSAFNAASLSQTTGTGDTTLSGAVEITGAVDINTRGDITFGSTLDGDHDLTLATSTGDITFTGVVGGTTSLDAVSITNAGDVNINSAFNAASLSQTAGTGDTTLGGAVEITNDAGLTTGGAVRFADATNIGGTLEVTAAGIELDANVTAATLVFDASGGAGDITQMSGALTVTGATTLAAQDTDDIALGSAGNNFTGSVKVSSAANLTLSDANALTLDAVSVTVNADVDAGGLVDFIELAAIGGTLDVNTTANNAGGGAITDSVKGRLAVTGATTLTAGGNDITLDNFTNDFTGAVNVGSAADLTLVDENTLQLGAVSVTGNADIDSRGVVRFSGVAAIGGTLDVNTTVNNAGGGAISDNGGRLSVTGTTTLAAGPADITLDNPANDFIGAVSVSSVANLTLADANALTLGALGVTTSADIRAAGDITFSAALDGDYDLTLDAGGNIIFMGVVGGTTPLDAVSITNAGNVNINMAFSAASLSQTTGTGDTTFGGAVRISSAANINTTGDITFGSTLDGDHDLTLVSSTGDITFTGVVGGTTSLDAVSITNAGDVNISMAFNAVSLRQTMGTGDTTLGGAVEITGAVDINTTGDITFGSTLDGDHDLTLATSTGEITFMGVVGGTTPLDAVSITNAGNVNINMAFSAASLSQTTGTGDTTFGGAVRISSAANINTTGDITFGSTLDGDHDLTLATSTGDITFTGVVGGTTPLDAVSITNAGNVNINSAFNAASLSQTTGTGDTTLGGAVEITGAVDINTTGDITQTGGSLMVGGTTTLAAGGNDITLDNPANDFIGAVSVSSTADLTLVDANALTLGALGVTTSADISATGDITFSTALDGDYDLTLDAGGDITFMGVVGGTTPLDAVSITNAGNVNISMAFNAASLSQTMGTGDTTLSGAVRITSAANINTTGDITFGSTLDGDHDLTLATSTGDITFTGVVGGTTSLDAVSITNAGNVNISMAFNAASFRQTAGTGTTRLNGALRTSAAAGVGITAHAIAINNAITTTGNGAVTLTATTGSLIIAAAGAITADGAVALTANTGGINTAGDITTSNAAITFHSATTLTADVVLSSSGGDLTFAGPLNGDHALTLNAGNAGDIALQSAENGAMTALEVFTISNASDVQMTSMRANIIDIRAQNDFTAVIQDIADLDQDIDALTGDIDIDAGGVITLEDATGGTNGNRRTRLVSRVGGINVGNVMSLVVEDNDTSNALQINSARGVVLTPGDALVRLGDEAVAQGGTPTLNDAALNAFGNITLGTEAMPIGAVILDMAVPFAGGLLSIISSGAINDNNTGVAFTQVGGALRLTAGGAIGGTANPLTLDVGALEIISTAGNAVTVQDMGAGATTYNIGSANIAVGAVSLAKTSNNMMIAEINANGAVDLMATNAAANIIIDGALQSAGNAITILAGNDVSLTAAARINSQDGTVVIRADSGDGGLASGALMMADGALINAGGGAITLSADEDLTLGLLMTTNATDAAVSLSSREGGIVDGGDTGGADVQAAAGGLAINAAGGVGAGNGLETQVASMTIDADSIAIHEADALIVADIRSSGGASITAGDGVAFTALTTIGGLLEVIAPAIELNTDVMAGSLAFDASGGAGNIIQSSGRLTVAGITTLAAEDTDNITLGNAANDFTGAVTVSSANNLTLVDTNALILGALSITGDADVDAGGAVRFSGAAVIGGMLAVRAAAIDLNANVMANALDFDASGGAGDITQISGALMVAGATTLAAEDTDNITLGNAANDFMDVVGVSSAANLTLADASALTLGAVSITGNADVDTGGVVRFSDAVSIGGALDVDATANNPGGGAISDNGGMLSVTGTTTLAAGGNDITLDNAANDFIGEVSVSNSGANDVIIHDVNSLTIGMAMAGNDLRLNFDRGGGAATLDLAAATVTAGGTVFVNGNGANDALRITNTANAWTITGADAGAIDAGGTDYRFGDLAILIGNLNTDVFTFEAGARLSGKVDGLAGSDTLDFNGQGQRITITALGGVDGFTGEAVNGNVITLPAFDNISAIDGAPGEDTLVDAINADATFALTAAADTYRSSGRDLSFANIENLIAGTGNDTFNITGDHGGNLLGAGGDDVFAINAVLTGDIDGGADNDRFDFNGGRVIGSIDGQGGSDVLDYTRLPTPASVILESLGAIDGFSGRASGVDGGFENVNTLVGSAGVDALTGLDAAASWEVRGDGAVYEYISTNTLLLSAFEDLSGGDGDDRFNITGDHSGNLSGAGGDDVFAINAVLTGDIDGGADNDRFDFNGGRVMGSIDGRGGSDVLDYTRLPTPASVILESLGAIDGFSGRASGVDGGFENVNTLVGSAGVDALTGLDAAASWEVRGDGAVYEYISTNTLLLSAFEDLSGGDGDDRFNIAGDHGGNLFGAGGDDVFAINAVLTGNIDGGADNDRFDFNGGRVTGSIDGRGGSDVLDYTRLSTPAGVILESLGAIDGFSGRAGGVDGGFENVNTLVGSAGVDALTGLDAAASWEVRGDGAVYEYISTNTLLLSAFEDLSGGDGDDRFNIAGDHSGNLFGAGGDDVFAINAVLTGDIDGQTGLNTFRFNLGGRVTGDVANTGGTTRLDFSNAESVTVRLTGLGANGFTGESTVSGTFSDVSALTGSAGVDALIGLDAAAVWEVSGGGASYESTNTLLFAAFEDLSGGGGDDRFNITGDHTGSLLGAGGDDVFAINAVLTGSIDGGGGDDRFDFNGGRVTGDIDGQAGVDSLTFAAGSTTTLNALGTTDGFAGTASNVDAFDNIDDVSGSGAVDTLIGDFATGGAFTVAANGGAYTSTNTLTFSAIENLLGADGADTFNINATYGGNINGAGGDDVINFIGGSLSGNVSAGVGNNTYMFTGGTATGVFTIAGDDTWVHASGVPLGSAVVGGADTSLTAPGAPGSDLTVGSLDLRLPTMTGFNGALIIGGTLTPPSLPVDGASAITVNTDLLTVSDPVITSGDVVLLGAEVNLAPTDRARPAIDAGGLGGDDILIIAVGETEGGSGSGDIVGGSLPTNIQGGSLTLIAVNDVIDPGNIEIRLGGGNLQISLGQGNDAPLFLLLDATAIELDDPTRNFIEVAFPDLNLLSVGQDAAQANPAGSFLGLEQLSFIDASLFQVDLNLFGSIGGGIALSLAQCEEVEGCAPDVTETELNELIANLQARIQELETRLQEQGPSGDEVEIAGLLAGYQDELDNFQSYREQLEDYYASEAELDEDLDDDFFAQFADEGGEGDLSTQVQQLRDVLAVNQQRIEWLDDLKADPGARAGLSEKTGIDLTIESLDAIIDATRQAADFIDRQIKLLLQGTEARLHELAPLNAGTIDRRRLARAY